MSVSLIANISKYIGVSTDAKPTGVPVGSEFFETNTRLTYICHDGTNWAQKITSPSGPTAMDAKTDPAANAATTTTIIDAYGGTVITTTAAGNSQTIGDPTITTAGKLFTVANNDTSTHSVPIVANGVTFTVTPGEAQTFIWDGSAWGPIDIGITAIPVIVSQGGTGLATITDHSVMVGSGTGAVTPISVGASGEILAGVTGADPAFTATPSGLTSIGVTTVNATTVNATTFDTNVAAAGVTLSGTTLAADGTDADIDINITPKGTGEVNISKADIDAGTIDGAVLGVTKTNIQKGPPIVTTFAGTVTAAASTTVTFSSAADAILAGYDATNPVLGVTLISNALTRYIVSWTNSTTCVVDSSVTWAGTAITSVQFPIATFVNSAGVTTGWMNAAGNVYFVGNVGLGTATPTEAADVKGGLRIGGVRVNNSGLAGFLDYLDSSGTLRIAINGKDATTAGQFSITIRESDLGGALIPFLIDSFGNILTGGLTAAGTSAAKVFAIASGTAPTTSPADAAQVWVQDNTGQGAAGLAQLYMRDEFGVSGPVAFALEQRECDNKIEIIPDPDTLTTQLTSITHTEPGAADYAIQDLIDSGVGSAFGFATKDEGNTVLKVILNLQTRVAELEAQLKLYGILS